MIKLYERLTKDCKSQNMLNRVHINLENWMTPQQFIALYTKLKSKQNINEQTVVWIKKLENYFLQTKKIIPEPFVKRRLDQYTVYFSSEEQTIKKEDKTLLMCFTGGAQRMMMPIPLFLQYLDAENVDVILFKHPKGNLGYGHGIPPYDNSFKDMLNRLGRLPFNEYKNVSAMGTSAGALTALLISLKYEFNSALLVGCLPPNDTNWSESPVTMIERFQKNAKKPPLIHLVFGSGESKDIKTAHELNTMLTKAKLIQIGNKSHLIGHNALQPLFENGKFSELLKSTIMIPKNEFDMIYT